MLPAFIFDMDGVLVDAELAWRALGPEFLCSLVPLWSEEQQRKIHGMSVLTLFDYLRNQHQLKLSKSEFLANYTALAEDIYGSRCALIPNVLDCITELLALGHPLALASSSPRAWVEIVTRRFQLSELFAVIVSAEDVGDKPKPDPAIYNRTRELLLPYATKGIALEDTQKGLTSAKAAALFAIGIRNGFNQAQDFSAADFVLESFSADSRQKLVKFTELLAT